MRNFKSKAKTAYNIFVIGIALAFVLSPVTASNILVSTYQLIQDEGSNLARRTTMNFVGAGVVVTDAGGKTVVTISGGGTGGSCGALTGDVSGTCDNNIVQKVDGVAYPATALVDVVPVVTTLNAAEYKAMPDCDLTLNALNYDVTGHNFSCRTLAAQLHAVTFVIDGGGSAIATGACGLFPTADYTGTIIRTDISADVSGIFTLDVWKKAGAIPTGSDKISASAPVTLSSSQLNQNGSISGWGTSVSAGDVFGCTVATSTTVTRVMVQIWIQ